MGQAMDDDDFSEEIQDIGIVQIDTPTITKNIFSIQYGKDSYWFGFRRHARKLTEHHMMRS
jgi:hypothetical protein